MARGFLSGVILGGIVSVGVAGVVSVVLPPPSPPEVTDAAPGVATPEPVTQAGSGEAGSDSDATLATAPSAPQAPAPDPDTLSEIDDGTLSTAAVPQTGQASSLDTPAEATSSGMTGLEADEPVLPNPLALAPMEPEAADELSISTEPAQPPQPQAEAVTGAFDDPAQPLATDAPDDAALPAAEEAETAEVVPDTAEPAKPTSMTEEPVAEESLAEAAPMDEAPAPATVVSPEPTAEDDSVQTAALSDAPTIGTPAVSLLDRDSGISIRRPASEATAVTVADNVPATPNATGQRPIEQFAQMIVPQDGKPLMSIVLIDDGQSPTNGAVGIAALNSFPYPISFAVDSSLADAPERMARLRAAGFEVLAMIALPEGAQATDVETTFAATLSQLPEVIGVLDDPLATQQSSREVSDQVAAYLAGSGHGWVTQAKGLNTAATLAAKEGVPAKPIFRDFDSKGQTAVVIRRFLDQAAFRAGQESGVIMLGRLRPETISALLLWGLQDRAEQVALVPVSTVLLEQE